MALEEAVRRIGSIALVHETLSGSSEESVEFDSILDRLVSNALELSPRTSEIAIVREGKVGSLEPRIATPLALVVTELIHNALEHGLAISGSALKIIVARTPTEISIQVCDDGGGLPAGFDLTASSNLGLQIVRTLTENELRGRLSLTSLDIGTDARIIFPL